MIVEMTQGSGFPAVRCADPKALAVGPIRSKGLDLDWIN